MKIIKQSLSEQIYKILKDDIINHRIKFGEILVNKRLQERFQVSSTPIRDAIFRLKDDGIIDSITRSGAKLINFDYDFAIKVNQLVMIVFLGTIKYSLIDNMSEKFIGELKKNVDLQRENLETEQYYEYDYRFHKTFFDYCNNVLLKDIFKKYNLINHLLVRCYHEEIMVLKNRKRCVEEHLEIIDSIEKRDISRTLKLMKQHYLGAEVIFKKIKEENEKIKRANF